MKNKVSNRQCSKCVYYVANYKDDFTLRNFGYGEIKYRPACKLNKTYNFVSHNPATKCNWYEVLKNDTVKATNDKRNS